MYVFSGLFVCFSHWFFGLEFGAFVFDCSLFSPSSRPLTLRRLVIVVAAQVFYTSLFRS